MDNASSDKTIPLLEKGTDVTSLIRNDQNLGFGRANNLGIKSALSDGCTHLLFLNQDASIGARYLKNMIKILDTHQDLGLISPIHLASEDGNMDQMFAMYLSNGQSSSSYPGLVELPFVNAALWLMRSEVVKEVGGFNTAFHHYGEDNNYIQRLLFRGYKIAVDPNSEAFHFRDQSQLRKKFQKHSYRNFEKTSLMTFLKPQKKFPRVFLATLSVQKKYWKKHEVHRRHPLEERIKCFFRFWKKYNLWLIARNEQSKKGAFL